MMSIALFAGKIITTSIVSADSVQCTIRTNGRLEFGSVSDKTGANINRDGQLADSVTSDRNISCPYIADR